MLETTTSTHTACLRRTCAGWEERGAWGGIVSIIYKSTLQASLRNRDAMHVHLPIRRRVLQRQKRRHGIQDAGKPDCAVQRAEPQNLGCAPQAHRQRS